MYNDRIQILPYRPPLKPYFKLLNQEWLNKFFFLTAEDEKILANPEKIISDGGCVVFAGIGDEIVGTCALIKRSDQEYEIAKMGVTEREQGKKIGSHLLTVLIEEAVKRGATLISLETAQVLKAAIALYTKYGFVQTEDERIHPMFGRKTFRMELKLL
jgi:ribosomal protein S18 acetylase RimI-like enzyme